MPDSIRHPCHATHKATVRRVLAATALALATALPGPQAQPTPQDPRRSGFQDMSPATQAMQRDDTANPAMLWVKEGEALWQRPAGAANKACITCHAQAASSMRGVAARYPAWDTAQGKPITLAQRINQCRQQHQQAAPQKPESEEALSLEAYVAHQSRGLPITPPTDPRLAAARERGEALWRQRIGQVNLSCAQCHDARAGQRLAGSVIPQGHATGYPLYRLEWQGIGSLERRIRGCMTGVRAEAYGFDSRELGELQVYLAGRAAGMSLESPGVRP